ncbi:DUF411 domain-containing protein [Psychrobacter sp. AOP7-C1-14]|uniref:DUF411 domain-containing protein n=2 Tax=unclassified Psychrobacter TaxID=196806 RepID=UPI00402B56C4
MTRSSTMYRHKGRKMFNHVCLLSLTSLLFACSQPESDVDQKVQTEKSATIDSKATQISETKPVMLSQTESSTLLKNVSATVYTTENCGCCEQWVANTKEHGLRATVQHPDDLSLFKDRYDVPQQMRTCHTAVTTDGYVFEGHVPAKHMAQFLANPPKQAMGLAVPGMPVGSPGMEQGNQFEPYQVMQMNKDGTTEVYANIESPQQQL